MRQKQAIFIRNLAKLILWAFDQGYELTIGEAYRTQEQQDIYLKTGKTKVKHSKHQDRLAVDLNLFINGEFIITRDPYEPLVKYWKSMHPDNIAGYDWGWDANHFEMK